MRVLVTGAAGFVGRHLVAGLAAGGHEVVAGVRAGEEVAAEALEAAEVRPFDLLDPDSVTALAAELVDGVVHLAGWSAPGHATPDPGLVYAVNAGGSARLAEAVAAAGEGPAGRPRRFLHVSSGLVYGPGRRQPARESDPVRPVGVYAGSKLASEIAVLEVHRRTGLEAMVVRAFGHTGAGQDERFVVPAFVRRVREAQRLGAVAIGTGNLEPVRDFLHVADVVDAYGAVLERGTPGEVYNVASGAGITIRDLFLQVAEAVGYPVVPEVDAPYVRRADPGYVVGDSGKLRDQLHWVARRTLAEAIREVVNAQAK